MRAVAVAGLKKSGKTSLMGLLAEALERRGLSVSIVKYSSRPLDTATTDTFWLMRPGRTVASVSPEETVLFWSRAMTLAEMLPMLACDVLLVEGWENGEKLPRIICLKDGDKEEWKALSARKGTSPAPLLAVVGPGNGKDGVPYFEELTAESADELAGLILSQGKDLSEDSVCMCGPGTLSLSAGKEDIALPSEAMRELEAALSRVLRQCKGVSSGDEVRIRFVAG